MQDVYAHFSAAYASQVAAGEAAIAFEPFGLMPGIDPASAGAKATALEYLSINADFLPVLTAGSYMPTQRTASATYKIMLGLAQPSPTGNLALFNALKASASELLQNGVAGSTLGAYTYYPAFASPPGWFDITAPSIWTSYGYTATPPTASSASAVAPPVPHPPVPRPPLRFMQMPAWHLTADVPAAPVGEKPATQAAPAAATFNRSPAFINRIAPLPIVHPIWVGPAGPPRPPTPPTPAPPPPPPPPDLHPDFSLSFDYCVVQLRRPWLSGDFLASSGWFVPGAKAGDLAQAAPAVAAPADSAASVPGATRTPPLSWLPVACIAIKNLNISVGAGFDAATASRATAFGPFAVRPVQPGGGATTDRLTNPGVQIVAWVCAAQPQLPPETDPALLSTISTGTTAGPPAPTG